MWRWAKRVMVVGLLLLSSGIAVLWVRSHFVTESYRYARFIKGGDAARTVEIGSWRGGVFLQSRYDEWTGRVRAAPGDRAEFYYVSYESLGGPHPESHPDLWYWSDSARWKCAGFEWRSLSGDIGVTVPFWFLLLVTGLFPVVAGVRSVRRRRREGRRGFAVEVNEISADGGEGAQKSG